MGDGLALQRNWTPAEDEQLRVAVEKRGARSWKLIARELDGRTDVQVGYRPLPSALVPTHANRLRPCPCSPPAPVVHAPVAESPPPGHRERGLDR